MPKTKSFDPASSSNRGMDIEALISAPLIAAATANGMMAREQIQFLMDFCFQKDDNGNYHPVMLNLSMTRALIEPGANVGDPSSIRYVKSQFELPMLTMVPVNSLAVETVDVEFEMEVTNQTHGTDENNTSSESAKKGLDAGPRPKLVGKISYDSKERVNTSSKREYSSKNNSSLKVSVHAKQLPIPGGIAAVLEMYNKSIHPLEIDPEKEKNNEQNTGTTTT